MECMGQSAMNSTCEDEPTPKHLKTSPEGTVTSNWAHLPSLEITEVFSMLNKEDRRNASVVCKNWRENYFQPRLWSSFKFSLQPNELQRSKFLADTFGMTVTYAKIVLHSVSSEYLKVLISLLQILARNNNLKDLVIAYSPTDFVLPYLLNQDEDRSVDLEEVANLLKMCLPRLSRFSADCMEALSLCVGTILENLNPLLVTRLGLTSMTSFSRKNRIDPVLFKRLTKLKVLRIDQHTVTDALLDVVESCAELKKLVVYHRTYLTDHLEPSERAASFHPSVYYRPSRRFIQLFRSNCVFYNIRVGNLGQEIIVTRVLLF